MHSPLSYHVMHDMFLQYVKIDQKIIALGAATEVIFATILLTDR